MIYILIWTYIVLGVILGVYVRRVNATGKGMFASRGGFDKDFYSLFAIVWLLSPVSLPLILFIAGINYVANKIYDRWFKPIL